MGDFAQMKIVDLFCGCGGFSLGAHQAGFEVVVAYDKDEILTSSFERNFPDTRLILRNVGSLTGEDVRRDTSTEIDGIIGGPPCQGFSSIGRRDPNDPRRELLGHFFRVVSEVQPKFFVMENVRGLAFSNASGVLDAATNFVTPHYDVTEPIILDSSDYGAATRRPRLFVIGIRKDLGAPFNRSQIEERMRAPVNVRQAISDLMGARPVSETDNLTGFDRWRISRPGRPSDYAANLRDENREFTGNMPTRHGKVVARRFVETPPGSTEKIGRHYRLDWLGTCPTLRAGTGSDLGSYQSVRPIHPELPRVITVREAARLQGFPDSHLFHPTIWHSFRMIGNSVAPPMAKELLSAIFDHVSGLPVKRDSDCRRIERQAA